MQVLQSLAQRHETREYVGLSPTRTYFFYKVEKRHRLAQSEQKQHLELILAPVNSEVKIRQPKPYSDKHSPSMALGPPRHLLIAPDLAAARPPAGAPSPGNQNPEVKTSATQRAIGSYLGFITCL